MTCLVIPGLAVLFAASLHAQDQEKPLWQDFCCYEKGRVVGKEATTVVYEIEHGPEGKTDGLAEWEKLLKPYLTDKGSIVHSDILNTFTVTDTAEGIAKIETMLKIIHEADAPVEIEIQVIELRWDDDLQIGLEGDLTGAATAWTQRVGSEAFLDDIRVRFNPSDALLGAPFQGSAFRFSTSSKHQGTFGGLLQMFVERGHANILSRPKVIVRAGRTAKIFTGDEVPYPTGLTLQGNTEKIAFSFKKAGVSLEVTPYIAAPGTVRLKIKPEVITTFGFLDISGTQVPQFTTRSVETELIVRDGKEVTIGGLLRTDKTTVRRGLPFLSDIPLIGVLFGKYEDREIKQEILFTIKPTILKTHEELPKPPTQLEK